MYLSAMRKPHPVRREIPLEPPAGTKQPAPVPAGTPPALPALPVTVPDKMAAVRAWLDEEVVIAGRPVRRKYLAGVIGAGAVLLMFTGGSKKAASIIVRG